jgi:HAT1-interacting factor 1
MTFDPATSTLLPRTQGPAGAADPTEGNPLGGILVSILGESKDEQRKRVDDATKGARDLTGLVRRKKATDETEAGGSKVNGGKRKADAETAPQPVSDKRARVEEATD